MKTAEAMFLLPLILSGAITPDRPGAGRGEASYTE